MARRNYPPRLRPASMLTTVYSAAAAVGLIVILVGTNHAGFACIPLSILLARVAIARIAW